MEQVYRVLGARRFNDSVEGKAYNFTKLRIEMPVPRNAENECGTNVVEAVYGKSDMYDEVKRITFPCDCMLDMEMTSRGFDVHTIKAVPGQAKVKAA